MKRFIVIAVAIIFVAFTSSVAMAIPTATPVASEVGLSIYLNQARAPTTDLLVGNNDDTFKLPMIVARNQVQAEDAQYNHHCIVAAREKTFYSKRANETALVVPRNNMQRFALMDINKAEIIKASMRTDAIYTGETPRTILMI